MRAIVLKARQMGISTYVAARYYKQDHEQSRPADRDHRSREAGVEKPVSACEALPRAYAGRAASIHGRIERRKS